MEAIAGLEIVTIWARQSIKGYQLPYKYMTKITINVFCLSPSKIFLVNALNQHSHLPFHCNISH